MVDDWGIYLMQSIVGKYRGERTGYRFCLLALTRKATKKHLERGASSLVDDQGLEPWAH